MFRYPWRSTQYLPFIFVIRTGLSALFVLILHFRDYEMREGLKLGKDQANEL